MLDIYLETRPIILTFSLSQKPGTSEKEKGTADGYDIKARSLQFEIRGKVRAH